MWDGGTVHPKTMNTAGFYLLLLALFILTSILNANFLTRMILEINREYWKLIVWALCFLRTIYRVMSYLYVAAGFVYNNLQPEYELPS